MLKCRKPFPFFSFSAVFIPPVLPPVPPPEASCFRFFELLGGGGVGVTSLWEILACFLIALAGGDDGSAVAPAAVVASESRRRDCSTASAAAATAP